MVRSLSRTWIAYKAQGKHIKSICNCYFSYLPAKVPGGMCKKLCNCQSSLPESYKAYQVMKMLNSKVAL